MIRETRSPRPDHITKLEHFGFSFHTFAGQAYWNETAAYQLTESEVTTLEIVTNELHALCLAAVEHIIRKDRFDEMHIPEMARPAIIQSWESDPPAIYGRFDLAYNGSDPPKMLEYNADTPTSLLEAAVIQWHWLQEVEPEADQFNSIWEALVKKWQDLKSEGYCAGNIVHFGCVDVPEDLMTTAVMMDTAQEADLTPILINMSDIGFDASSDRFVDLDCEPINTIFKLYPWEVMIYEEFGTHALRTLQNHRWIEPIWKMLLSNKAILTILWDLFPGHPNLLRATFTEPAQGESFVRKPILGREGANVTINENGNLTQTDGEYGDQPVVFQEFARLPEYGGNHAVVGSWVVDGKACGIGIRESESPITQDLARFVPHYFYHKEKQ